MILRWHCIRGLILATLREAMEIVRTEDSYRVLALQLRSASPVGSWGALSARGGTFVGALTIRCDVQLDTL